MPGEFTPAARRAILEANLDRCAGCGHTGRLETQHRRARMMGGTSRDGLGQAPNGVALCRPCHAWTEANPDHARALGWRLGPNDDPLDVPWWTVAGWRRWVLIDGTPLVALVDLEDTPPEVLAAATDARVAFTTDQRRRDAHHTFGKITAGGDAHHTGAVTYITRDRRHGATHTARPTQDGTMTP